MSFNGYLLKCGSMPETINNKPAMSIEDSEIRRLHSYIIAQSYKPSKKVFDLGSFRDADGVLKRNVLDHISWTISFNVRPVNNTQMQEFLGLIRKYFTNAKERKLNITFYNPENDNYVTAAVYMPDPEFNIDTIDWEDKQIKYRETTIKFIGY